MQRLAKRGLAEAYYAEADAKANAAAKSVNEEQMWKDAGGHTAFKAFTKAYPGGGKIADDYGLSLMKEPFRTAAAIVVSSRRAVSTLARTTLDVLRLVVSQNVLGTTEDDVDDAPPPPASNVAASLTSGLTADMQYGAMRAAFLQLAATTGRTSSVPVQPWRDGWRALSGVPVDFDPSLERNTDIVECFQQARPGLFGPDAERDADSLDASGWASLQFNARLRAASWRFARQLGPHWTRNVRQRLRADFLALDDESLTTAMDRQVAAVDEAFDAVRARCDLAVAVQTYNGEGGGCLWIGGLSSTGHICGVLANWYDG